MNVSYLYQLSDFNGTVPYEGGRMFTDTLRNEVYVAYGNSVRVFNASGMEVYRFGDDQDLGRILDLAMDGEGNLLVLSYQGQDYAVLQCNFRGEPVAKMTIQNIPPEFSPFSPNRMGYRDGRLYLADTASLRIAVTDSRGLFETGYDLVDILGLKPQDRGAKELGGFSLDRDGNMLFTIPVLFTAFVLSPDRTVKTFGQPGSTPGKFNIVAGIAADARGNYLVVDVLKCAVTMFDRNFKFLVEFGYRGLKPGSFIAPQDIVFDGNDTVYVTQGRKRGISAFRIAYLPQGQQPEHPAAP